MKRDIPTPKQPPGQLISYSLDLGTAWGADVTLCIGRHEHPLVPHEETAGSYAGDIDLGREILGARLYIVLKGDTPGPNEYILAELAFFYRSYCLGSRRLSLKVLFNTFSKEIGYLFFSSYDDARLVFEVGLGEDKS